MSKNYTYREYLEKFTMNCLDCEGSGVKGQFRLNLRICESCDGTGRRDKKTLEDLVRDVVVKDFKNKGKLSQEIERSYSSVTQRQI